MFLGFNYEYKFSDLNDALLMKRQAFMQWV